MFPLRFVDHMDSGTTLKNRDQIAEERQKGRQGNFQKDASKHKGQVTLPNRSFRKSLKGGGVIQNLYCRFCPL